MPDREESFSFGINGIVSSSPNPFNPTTTIHYSIPNPSPVQVNIYNLQGHLIRNLNLIAGSVVWNGQDPTGMGVASGTYIVRINVGERVMSKRIVLMK